MSELISTKPYMVRAIHEWCLDNALTPQLAVVVNAQTLVPKAHVKDGEIVLNVSDTATKGLHIDNEAIVFSARFGGVSQNIYIPMDALRGVFARENGQGMFFEIADQQEIAGLEEAGESDVNATEDTKEKTGKESKKGRPNLTIVK